MLYILIILLLLVTGYVLKNNVILSLFLIGILQYFFTNVSPESPDYGNYFQYYYGGEYYRNLLQKGYESVSIFFLNQGYSFKSFRLLIVVVSLFLIWLAAKKWTKNVAWVFAFYLIACFPLDVIQIRNFIMLGFSTLAITILRKKDKFRVLISLSLIWIGSQFHTMGLIYIPIVILALVSDKFTNKIQKYCVPIAVLGAAIFSIGSSNVIISSFARVIGQLTSNESQLTNKLTERYTTGTSWSMIAVVMLTNIVVWYAVNKIAQNDRDDLDQKTQEIVNTMKNVSAYGMLLLPLMFIAPDYSRVFRNLNLLAIIFFVMVLSNSGMNFKTKKLAFFSLIIIGLGGISIWGRYFNILF